LRRECLLRPGHRLLGLQRAECRHAACLCGWITALQSRNNQELDDEQECPDEDDNRRGDGQEHPQELTPSRGGLLG